MKVVIANNLRELRFSMLMDVYSEGNQENAAANFPHLSPSLALLQQEQEFFVYLNECFFATKGAFYAILEVDGEYVSALRLEPYLDGLLLEALETHPDKRGMGYAKSLLSAVLEPLEVPVYSHVSKDNEASLHVHFSCGGCVISDCAEYIDGSLHENSYTLCFGESNRKRC